MQSEGQTCAHSAQPMQAAGSIFTLRRPSYVSSLHIDRRAAEVHARLAGEAARKRDRHRRALDLDRIEHARALGDHHRNALEWLIASRSVWRSRPS